MRLYFRLYYILLGVGITRLVDMRGKYIFIFCLQFCSKYHDSSRPLGVKLIIQKLFTHNVYYTAADRQCFC